MAGYLKKQLLFSLISASTWRASMITPSLRRSVKWCRSSFHSSQLWRIYSTFLYLWVMKFTYALYLIWKKKVCNIWIKNKIHTLYEYTCQVFSTNQLMAAENQQWNVNGEKTINAFCLVVVFFFLITIYNDLLRISGN